MPHHSHGITWRAKGDGEETADSQEDGPAVVGEYTNADKPSEAEAGNGPILTQSVGGGEQFNNMQPYCGIHYIIALWGTYPSRN